MLRRMTVCLQYWPQLAALYLLGLLARRGVIELAAWAGHDNDLWASLIMPLAGMARLGSFVAIFLVLRPAFPELAPDPSRPSRRVDLFTTVIVPFFAIYLAWQMFKEDWLAFESRSLDYRLEESFTPGQNLELHPETLPVGTTTWVLIATALVVRLVLSRVSARLPVWMQGVRVYVDALWVFLALTFSVNQGLTLLINPAAWISERRIVVWFNQVRSDVFSHVNFLEKMWDGVMWALSTAFGGAAIPLLWLAVAGIVYRVSMETADWRAAARRVVGRRADMVIERATQPRERFETHWEMVPSAVRTKTRAHATEQLGKFRPVVDSGRLIAHGGLLGLSLYVLAYLVLAWLDMSGSFYGNQTGPGYLFRGVAWLLGPHPWTFWLGVRDPLIMGSHLLIEPLRICLIATTLAYCVWHVRAATTPPTAAAAQGFPHQSR